jgi:hypothetical protein
LRLGGEVFRNVNRPRLANPFVRMFRLICDVRFTDWRSLFQRFMAFSDRSLIGDKLETRRVALGL